MITRQENITPQPIPRHIAIIMDGNGRWAKARHLPRKVGHRQGVEAVRGLVRASKDLGLEYLTLYGFSSENWSRPVSEVRDLLGLLRHYIQKDLKELAANNIRIRIIGERDNLSDDLVSLVEDAEEQTKTNTGLNLIIAFNYGGRDELVTAAQNLAKAVERGDLKPEDITQSVVSNYLYTADFPEPDLIIRTSGEQRLSNFLTWQSAYSEFVFIPTLWPDFSKEDLLAAIEEYHSRDRRFGGRPEEEDSDTSEISVVRKAT